MSYVDGFVIAVPKKNRAMYKKMAQEGKRMWMKYGAVDYKECRIDDAKPKWVEFTFPKMIKAKAGEDVWFSYIVYKNKKHRNAVNAKVMGDMAEYEKKGKKMDMPFKMNRMAMAGFIPEVEA